MALKMLSGAAFSFAAGAPALDAAQPSELTAEPITAGVHVLMTLGMLFWVPLAAS